MTTTRLSASERKLWGVATMDEGIISVHITRTDAVMACGFCTPIKRETIRPGLYEYTCSSYQRVVGRLGALQDAGFERNTPEDWQCLSCRMGLPVAACGSTECATNKAVLECKR